MLVAAALIGLVAVATVLGLLWRASQCRVVRPRLTPPAELENPTPPTFAQGVGFAITAIGVILTLLGATPALPIAAALAFVAAFLNSVFGYCLGCQIYLLLVRARVLGRTPAPSA